MKHVPLHTLTIGIPAYNEEQNIVYLLESVMRQERENFILERVIVISDGSTDTTEDLVRDFAKQHSIVELVADAKRLGQGARLNQLYAMNTSDVLVNFDGDTTLGHDHVLERIVKEFEDGQVGLVGGNDTPLPARTFFERIVITNIALWYNVRKDLNGGDTVYNHHGCVSALSRELCKKAAMPNDIIAQDTYLYFRALELGLKFRHAKNAIVHFRAPSTFRDYCAQVARFTKTKSKITDHFGLWIEQYRFIPKEKKIKALVLTFLQNPITTFCALLLRSAGSVYTARRRRQFTGPLWTPVQSTKEGHKK